MYKACHLPHDTCAPISVPTSVKTKSSHLDYVFQADWKSHSIRAVLGNVMETGKDLGSPIPESASDT